jgi:hypothetical protein
MTNTQYIVVNDRQCGWSILNLRTNTVVEGAVLVEGGFSSREAAEDYLQREYPEESE